MVRRSPEEYNFSKLEFDQTILKKHFTPGRRKKLKRVVIHHMTIRGTGSGSALTACYTTWQNRAASAHYGVDGKHIRQFVWDGNTAWATGNSTANHESISIEHANSTTSPNWTISDTTWKNGAKLAAYIHAVYKLGRPTSNAKGTSGTLVKHKTFASTACPGPYMDKIWGDYVAEAQRVYDNITGKPKAPSNARLFGHAHLNTKGDDVAGAASFNKRFPTMLKDLISTGCEVITLNEVATNEQRQAWQKGFITEGYNVISANNGNLIAAVKNAKIMLNDTFILPDKVQGKGRKEALGRARLGINGDWINVGCAHLEYRDGAPFDEIRVKQAESIYWSMRRIGIYLFKTPFWKEYTSIGIDENSKTWVRDKVFLKRGFKVAVKINIDAIYGNRTTKSNGHKTTDSDHPIVWVTYGKKLK